MNQSEKKRIAKKATITAFLIVVTFVILGKLILEVFGITIPAFKITGGILIFYVGFEMLQAKKSKVHQQDDIEPDDGIAISPLAIPILAGSGTIVRAMSNVTDASLIHIGIVIVIFAIMIGMTYLAFRFSDLIVKKIEKNLLPKLSDL